MHRVLIMAAAGLGAAVVMSGSALADSQSNPGGKTPPPPAPKTYQVQEGDSLSTIAQTENLDSWRPLWNANTQIQDPDLIYSGQQLTVPDGPTTDRPLPGGTDQPVQTSTQSPVSTTTQVYRPVTHAANYADGAPGLMQRIRMRESGGNYATNTGNGYYGAYQFTVGTWESVGGSGLPSNASPSEQDMRAQMLYNERGCSPWPNTCY